MNEFESEIKEEFKNIKASIGYIRQEQKNGTQELKELK